MIDDTRRNNAKFNYVQESVAIYHIQETRNIKEYNETKNTTSLCRTDRCILSPIPTIVETFRHISTFPRRRFALLSLSPTALGIALKIYDVHSVWIRKFLRSRMRYSTLHINTKRSVSSHSTIFQKVSGHAVKRTRRQSHLSIKYTHTHIHTFEC